MLGQTDTQFISRNKKLWTLFFVLIGGYAGIKMFFPTLINVKKNPSGNEIGRVEAELGELNDMLDGQEIKTTENLNLIRKDVSRLKKLLESLKYDCEEYQ